MNTYRYRDLNLVGTTDEGAVHNYRGKRQQTYGYSMVMMHGRQKQRSLKRLRDSCIIVMYTDPQRMHSTI